MTMSGAGAILAPFSMGPRDKDTFAMTPVRILRNFPISPDGIRVEHWQRNDVRVVDDATLELLIEAGACEIHEVKAEGPAPENKSAPRKRGRPRKVAE